MAHKRVKPIRQSWCRPNHDRTRTAGLTRSQGAQRLPKHRLTGTTGRLDTCNEPAFTIYPPLITIFRQGTDGHGDRAGSHPIGRVFAGALLGLGAEGDCRILGER
jgi:hypothetical protein